MLLGASYFFYAAWDSRFLALLILSTLIDYFCGLGLAKYQVESLRRKILSLSICGNLGILFAFKYYNFFAKSLQNLLANSGIQIDDRFLTVILPVGISFYTFQTMSYTIDVFRKKIPAESNLVYFSLYVAFFPQLVAGPIERAGNLIKQLRQPAIVDRRLLAEALWLIIYGLFKKTVVADNLAVLVKPVFDNPAAHHGLVNLLSLYAGAVYHYADFSGYSDMACGIARLFGVRLMFNFKLPFFQSNPRSFWSCWHVSLTLWFRDYVYVPLRKSNTLNYIPKKLHDPVAVITTFSLIGIWHGPQLHYFVWGLVNGLLIALYNEVNARIPTTLRPITQIPISVKTIIFHLWFFPAMGAFMVCHSTTEAILLLNNIFKPFSFTGGVLFVTLTAFAIPMFWIDGILSRKKNLLYFAHERTFILQGITLLLWLLILTSGFTSKHDFLYFQF